MGGSIAPPIPVGLAGHYKTQFTNELVIAAQTSKEMVLEGGGSFLKSIWKNMILTLIELEGVFLLKMFPLK